MDDKMKRSHQKIIDQTKDLSELFQAVITNNKDDGHGGYATPDKLAWILACIAQVKLTGAAVGVSMRKLEEVSE